MNKEVQVTYCLSDVDLAIKSGTLRVKQEGKRNIILRNVELSGQLISRIKHSMKDPKARKYVNVDFTSMLMSPSFEENPLKLVQFNREGQPASFKLQLVTDKGFYFKKYVNAMNQRVDRIVFKHWKKSEFIRYWSVTI